MKLLQWEWINSTIYVTYRGKRLLQRPSSRLRMSVDGPDPRAMPAAQRIKLARYWLGRRLGNELAKQFAGVDRD